MINHSNRAPSAFPKRQRRQDRISNMTCWTSEEKQHCVQAQKTLRGGAHQPFQSLVEHIPGLTHITAMLQLKHRQLRVVFSLYEYAGSNIKLRSSFAPTPPSQMVNFSSVKWCIISSVVLYNWLWGHAVNWTSKWRGRWATRTNEYCQNGITKPWSPLKLCYSVSIYMCLIVR